MNSDKNHETFENLFLPVQTSLPGYARKSDSTLWAWGNNSYGRLGDGTSGTNRVSPVQVVGLTNVTAIVAGQYNAYAINGDGTVSGRGMGGSVGDGTGIMRNAPVPVTGLSNVVAL